jgi:4-diphosphocytidyl-2-C-methyl-D-erythritol kinase
VAGVTADALYDTAPGKVNLTLMLGPTRADGYHELVSVVQAVLLTDRLTLEPAGEDADGDVVVCRGVEGDNLAGRALAAYRAASGWDAPPQRLTIDKQIPVAAGMGGGSSDAAAALRLAARAAGRPDDHILDELAFGLGADVPALLRPGRVLVTGAGEFVSPLPEPDDDALAVLILPSHEQLSTPAVFAEADRLGLGHDAAALAARRNKLLSATAGGAFPFELAVNDLEPAARSLCPAIDDALAAARDAGAAVAMVSGSGPTVFGLFEAHPPELDHSAQALRERFPGATVEILWSSREVVEG